MEQKNIVELVKSELKPSIGCTEPVAIGLAVSNTCSYMTEPAQKLQLLLSSNIFKNAYSVKIPNTIKSGILLAATLGYLLRDISNNMEIFSGVTDELVKQAESLISQGFVELKVQPDSQLYIEVLAISKSEQVRTITAGSHDNLVKVEKNGKILFEKPGIVSDLKVGTFDITKFSIQEIISFSQNVNKEDIEFLSEMVRMNENASIEGLQNSYGLQIGRSLKVMMTDGIIESDMMNTVKMVVAAASDCRMGGGAVSVMTVLGSGNQGFEVSLPVISVAQQLGIDNEQLNRALIMSILFTIFIKYQVGRLSPICGAVFSGAAASGAITWMLGGSTVQIDGAIQNMLGNLSGVLCDGAKDGCALKLSSCAGEAILCAQLALKNRIIQDTDGIIGKNAEETIKNVAKLSREGMAEVDMNIISTMLRKSTVKVLKADCYGQN